VSVEDAIPREESIHANPTWSRTAERIANLTGDDPAAVQRSIDDIREMPPKATIPEPRR